MGKQEYLSSMCETLGSLSSAWKGQRQRNKTHYTEIQEYLKHEDLGESLG